jgi:hypothetical protein
VGFDRERVRGAWIDGEEILPNVQEIQRFNEMDDSELFDVFSTDNNPEPEQKTAASSLKTKSKKPKKQKKDKVLKSASGKRSHDESEDAVEEEKTSPIVKRHRRNSENPIIVDSFETESDQIVPAAQGLQGTAAPDHNIVIKKKVCFSLFVIHM